KFPIHLTGSNIVGLVNMTGLELGAELFMDDMKVTDVSLRFAHVGFLSVINSSGSGVLGMTALHVDQFLTLEQARFAAVGLADARVDLELDLKDSKISYQLQMAGLRVGQDLRMSDVVMGEEAGFAEVVLLNAQVGGSLYLVGSVGTLIQMDGL